MNVVCVSDSDNESNPESGLDLTPSVLELDSTETVWSQVVLQKLQENKSSKTMMDKIMELISEPSGNQLLSENEKIVTPRVKMSSEKVKSSHPKPNISDTRVYSYDEMVDFEFNISPVETDFYLLK